MAPPVGKCEIFVRANVTYKCNSDFWPCFSFVEGQVGLSHGKRKMAEGRETSAGLQFVFYHARTVVSSTAGDVLVTCDTTYRTGLRDNNCPRAQKFVACSLDRARAFHIERNRVCKTVK